MYTLINLPKNNEGKSVEFFLNTFLTAFPSLTKILNITSKDNDSEISKISYLSIGQEHSVYESINKTSFLQKRNTFNNMVLRYIWARKMKDILVEPNTLFVFIDEAAVVMGKYKEKARGFYSVIPIVNKPLEAKKMSILLAVIPGFGTCYKWFNKSVKGFQYATFLREVSYICRTRLCNPSTLIVIIQDNCSIHKTVEVFQVAKKCKLNMFFTIPYSPQLNLLAENYFAKLKFFALYDFTAIPKEKIKQNMVNQHELPPYKIHIMKQWEEKTKLHYDSTNTAHIFGAWESILNTCIHGMPLSGQHIHQTSNYDSLILRQSVRGTRFDSFNESTE